MPLRALPTELLDHIVSFLPQRYLTALALVNAHFRHVAQRCLFRHVALNAQARTLRAVLVLARFPRLARYVRFFAIRIPFDTPLLRAFYSSLSLAVRNMSQLVELDLSLAQAVSWVLCSPESITFPRLRRFASAFHLDPHIVHFLNKTPALQELEIQSTMPNMHDGLLPNSLCNLTQFTGSANAAALIVPTRPVGCINIMSGDFTDELALTLARSVAPIHLLAAATTSHSTSLISTLTRCMGCLVHLRLVTTYDFKKAPDSTFFANVADALTLLPVLESCELWGVNWIASPKGPNDKHRVWEPELFNTAYIPPDDTIDTGAFLEDLYSNSYFIY